MTAHRDEQTGRWTLEGVEPSTTTYYKMLHMLRDKIHFKFARYGDGEFNCMFGKIGHNCDGHEYFPDMGMRLNEAFYSDPKYMVGIQPLSVQGGWYQKAVLQRDGSPKNIYDADAFHSASIDGHLYEFIGLFKQLNPVIVGPKYLSSLKAPMTLLAIPEKNCWLQFENICQSIDRLTNFHKVFFLCASMMSEVVIERFKDEDITMIDLGSVLDPYVLKFTRKYHHKLNAVPA